MSQLTEGAAGYRKSATRGGSGGGYDSYDKKVGTRHSDRALISTCRVSFIPIKSGGLEDSVRRKAHGSAQGNISENVKGCGRAYRFFIEGQPKKQMKNAVD